ncbi:ATP-dependent 6-phosphofructokinase [Alteromonas aestuariivivens]|uniref:6-phosphofructokinase n=1 Tax=Alteromonas aestuariivivens TaxID=1938339 RepID=A0A3D8M8L1_9ALTE|nr:ATP-dependent 6-phosphofructokinase [Alteromonas aestuariivivens]RDV26018.1 ATP-dependent 6-phosphofructokinase [Alteromonas aestuariivivens]
MTKNVAVLTSGGDAPGMNACIRAIVLACERAGYKIFGYEHGYNGLLHQEYRLLNNKVVHNLIQRGGTLLHSARCLEFKSEESARLAAANLEKLHIDALLVIGGDGSFRGAAHLGRFWKGQIIGLPGTIDNDISGTDATIGYYTAIETAVDSIDKVRDTADAFERIFLVEVMGRHSGFLGLNAALASASDYVILPELFVSEDKTVKDIVLQLNERREQKRKNISYIIVLTENLWPGGITALAERLTTETRSEVRPVILGHVQRGGSPVSQDRLLAVKLGCYAVSLIAKGSTGVMVGEQNGEAVEVPLEATWTQPKLLEKLSVETLETLMNNRYT